MMENSGVLAPLFSIGGIISVISVLLVVELGKIIYFTKFHVLKNVPGPWFICASSLWIRWQRWHGKLSFTADDLLRRYGPIVRISPNMVLVNDDQSLQAIFSRRDLDTAPKAIRALRVGGHDWTVTVPQNIVARQRRQPVMTATTTKNLQYWQPIFEDNINSMITALGASSGAKSEDIVNHLRVNMLRNSQVVMGGSSVKLDTDSFPRTVGEYNFLVVWRLCLPEWIFKWLKHGPFPHARFRIQSSNLLYKVGEEVIKQAKNVDPNDRDDAPTVYQLLSAQDEKKGGMEWTHETLSAEMSGQILAATETTSSALAFIFYELAKNPGLTARLYEELLTIEGNTNIDSLQLLDACIREGLRFRPPVAFSASRVAPRGGLDILGYFIPEGTVITTQSLSMSRQRPDLFSNYDVYDPIRWLEQDKLIERKRMVAAFGIGSRRCPGGNMALFVMRLIVGAVIREFKISVAPETTPDSMAPFEANGFRSRFDRCHLIFKPRSSLD